MTCRWERNERHCECTKTEGNCPFRVSSSTFHLVQAIHLSERSKLVSKQCLMSFPRCSSSYLLTQFPICRKCLVFCPRASEMERRVVQTWSRPDFCYMFPYATQILFKANTMVRMLDFVRFSKSFSEELILLFANHLSLTRVHPTTEWVALVVHTSKENEEGIALSHLLRRIKASYQSGPYFQEQTATSRMFTWSKAFIPKEVYLWSLISITFAIKTSWRLGKRWLSDDRVRCCTEKKSF